MPPRNKRARRNILTLNLVASLDRINISDRRAKYVLAATAQSLGQDVMELNINRSSIRRGRHRIRAELPKQLKEALQLPIDNCLT